MNKSKKDKEQKQKRVFNQLSLDDRVKIEVRYRDGWSLRKIAEYIGNGRTASSICREIAGKPRRGVGKYQAHISHEEVLKKRVGEKSIRLKNETVKSYTVEKLKLGWSPEQISIRLPIDHPQETISYESIYQYIYNRVHRQGNGKIKNGCEDLRQYLPRRHTRRQKKGFRKAQKLERPLLPSIEYRSPRVDLRKEVGHWEDDCMVSRKSKARLKTINERVSGVVLIDKMEDGSIKESNRAVYGRLRDIPGEYRKTLTRDRGTENFGYKELETNLNLSCYFAHPYSSYERGSNENLNGLIRRFLPKKTDFAKVSDEKIRLIEYLLNSRPRKRFGGKTPLEVLFKKTGVAINY